MGAGKTTVGRRLAARLGLGFVDLDEVLVQRFGCDVGAVFADHGEPAFRTAEREELTAVLAGPEAVIAVGGGAWCDPGSRAAARAAGAVAVWLDVPWPELWRRLSASSGGRPLLADEAATRALYEARRGDYSASDLAVSLDAGTTSDAAAALLHAALVEVACAT